MWARYLLSFGVAAVLLLALVLFVEHHNTNGPASTNKNAEVRANREAEVLVAQDQQPHVVTLHAGTAARAGLMHAVRADMSRRVLDGSIDGPLQRVRCLRSRARGAFSCTAVAANVNYDYLGVVATRAHRVTYCRRDLPPVPSQNIPVSPRCLG
jgi:hypothetical protein